MGIIPVVTQSTRNGERSADIYSRLLADRVIFLNDHIMSDNANLILAQLLYLESQDKDAPIYFYITSPGGSVTDGHAIRDVMSYITCPVSTIIAGQAASMAAVLACSGEKGMRYAFPHAEILFHTVSAGFWGKERDIEISAERTRLMNRELLEIIADNCGRPYEEVKQDLDHDFFLSAREAVEYGAVDFIIG